MYEYFSVTDSLDTCWTQRSVSARAKTTCLAHPQESDYCTFLHGVDQIRDVVGFGRPTTPNGECLSLISEEVARLATSITWLAGWRL